MIIAAITVIMASLIAGIAVATSAKTEELRILLHWLPMMFQGFLVNVLVSILSMAVGTALGILLGLGQISRTRAIATGASAITQLFRNAPWLVILFYVTAFLPLQIRLWDFDLPMPDLAKAVLGLSLPVMGNVAEIVRGGIRSVPIQQWEAAQCLGFSRHQTIWRIIVPQCIRQMLPPWMNLYAILTMATPLISIIGIEEAMTVTRHVLAAEGHPELMLPMYGLLLVWFFLYCYPISRWVRHLEQSCGMDRPYGVQTRS